MGGFLSPWNNLKNICTQQSSWKTQCHYLWKEIHYSNLMNKMNLLIHIVIMYEFAPTVLTNANIRIVTINQHVNYVWIASGLRGGFDVCKVPL
jgi:predicted ABC-type sugar transport system permease subunit